MVTHSAATTLGPLLSSIVSIQEASTTAERSISIDAENGEDETVLNGWDDTVGNKVGNQVGNQEPATNDVSLFPLCNKRVLWISHPLLEVT